MFKAFQKTSFPSNGSNGIDLIDTLVLIYFYIPRVNNILLDKFYVL